MGFIRNFFIRIDAIVYGILEQIFQLIINLANFDLFSAGVLDEFAKRMYLILGLVMVFKLIISFIQILIDPDKLSDKESGVANILKRVVISMILIVLVPSIFSFAKQLQNRLIILIPKVVLGIPLDVDDSQISYNATTTDSIANYVDEQGNVLTRTGKLMAYYSFLPFFYYSEGCEGLGTLNGTTAPDKSMNVEIYSVSDAVPHVNDKDGACSSTEDGYNYNYRYIISTLVGAYMVYVLVFVALKIAIRAIKFGLCQLIAPIPIASYIDPKSSKKAFDNWVSTSVKVYLDLFMRLIVVYFVIFVFRLLFDNEKFFEALGKYGAFQGLLVALLIIVGLLNFAKEMPKFVSGMLGVSDGFSDIGDMFKGAGGMLAAGIGSRVAAAGNFINGMRGEGTIGQRLRRATGSAIAGRFSGAYHGRMGALRGKGFKETWNTSTQGTWTRRQNRAIEKGNKIGLSDRLRVQAKDYLQLKDTASLAEDTIKANETAISNIDSLKSNLRTLYAEHGSEITIANSSNESMKKVRQSINSLIRDNLSAFYGSSADATLNSFFEKMRNGTATYQDLLSIRSYATENAGKSLEMASIANQLRDDNAVMKGIQKNMYKATAKGELLNTRGVEHTSLNLGSESQRSVADNALKEVFSKTMQDLEHDRGSLGWAGKDTDFVKLYTDDPFGNIEQKAKDKRFESRQAVGGKGAADVAAREAIQRRKSQNSKEK